MPLLPPVIATLLADTKEFMAKMTEAEHKMGKFGLAADASGTKFSKFANTASTAVVGLGIAIAGGAVDSALKFNEALDKIQNQAGASSSEIDFLKNAILKVSNETAISSTNIASAFLQAEKSGLRGAAAFRLVEAASKAAAITGGDVTQTTQTLVGIQNLQIAKGMSVAAVSDLMVEANKRHLGSLDSLTQTLTGKVGGALAAQGVSLAEMAAVSDVASAAGYATAKSYTQLATGLNKIENPTTRSAKAMAALGINADTLAKIARHPGTGLVDTLQYLETVSKKTGVSMNTLITDTFGPGAVGLVTTLANHVGTLAKNVNDLSKASASKLDTAFGITKGQLNFQLNQLRTQAENALKGVGLLLLPAVGDIAKFAENAVTYFGKHPILKTIFTDASLTLFAASLAYKVGNALGKLPIIGNLLNKLPGFSKLFGGQPTAAQAETQIGLLEQIAGNIEAIAGFSEKTAAEGAIADTEMGISDIEGAAGSFAPLLIPLLGGGLLLDLLMKSGKIKTPLAPPGMPTGLQAGQAPKGQSWVTVPLNNTGTIAQITSAQSAALDKWRAAQEANLGVGPNGVVNAQGQSTIDQQYINAVKNFAKQDTQRNYTLTVNIK